MDRSSPSHLGLRNFAGMEDIAIEMRNVTKAYEDKKALDQLSLRVHEGEIFGLLGHNGARKMTTVCIQTTGPRSDGDYLLR